LAVIKQAAHKFDGERFNLRKLNELEMKQYQINISNRFAALKNLSDSKDINMAWENIQENIKTSTKESFHISGFNFLQFYSYTTSSIVSGMHFSAMYTFQLGFFWLPALFGMVLPCTLDTPWVFVTVPFVCAHMLGTAYIVV